MSDPEPTGSECITQDDLRNLQSELRSVAARLLSTESHHHTYTPTALAMTALRRVKLKEQDWTELRWVNRAHFFASTARAMRNALIDHARRRQACGRNLVVYLPPDEAVFRDLPAEADERPERVLVLEEALARLEAAEPHLADLIQQHYYFGYSVPEMARFGEVSEKTIDRALKRARVLLGKFIADTEHPC
ncbi:MAG: antiterminator Q family protein [Limisphaerales bacterium]